MRGLLLIATALACATRGPLPVPTSNAPYCATGHFGRVEDQRLLCAPQSLAARDGGTP